MLTQLCFPLVLFGVGGAVGTIQCLQGLSRHGFTGGGAISAVQLNGAGDGFGLPKATKHTPLPL